MNNIYFISDTHFDEDRIFSPLNLFYRPFENWYSDLNDKDTIIKMQNSYMVKKINDALPEDAILYHLGDVSKTKEGLAYMDQIHCKEKHLIIGNYDDQFVGTGLLEQYFDTVQVSLDLGVNGHNYHLNHYPSKHVSGARNIVGHIHSLWKVQPHMVNVGVDAWNFLPIPLSTLEFCFGAAGKHYDINVFPMVDKKYTKYLNHPDFKSIDIIYSDEDRYGDPDKPSIFLCGPTPRGSNPPSWRPEAIQYLRDYGFEGTVYVPEPKDVWPEFESQVLWELNRLKMTDCVLFWVDRDLHSIDTMPDGSPQLSMPAFTTNVEFGHWASKGNTVYGRPDNAPKNRYLDFIYSKYTKDNNWDRPIFNNLESTVRRAMTYAVSTKTI